MTEKRRRLTAKTKYNIFLMTRAKDAPVGEILREYGLYLTDLKKIEETVEQAAITNLKTGTNSRNIKEVSVQEFVALQQELERKDKALAELSVKYMIFKKNDV